MTAMWAAFRWALPYAIAVAVVFGVCWFIYGLGVDAEHERRVAQVDTLNAQHITDIKAIGEENERALAHAQQDARNKEAASAQAMAELDKTHFKELQNAKAEAQRTIDGLRNGAVRVRAQYTCAPQRAGSATGGVPQAIASTGVGDGAAGTGLRPEDAAVLIGIADIGDAWGRQLLACQSILKGDRGQ